MREAPDFSPGSPHLQKSLLIYKLKSIYLKRGERRLRKLATYIAIFSLLLIWFWPITIQAKEELVRPIGIEGRGLLSKITFIHGFVA